MRRTSRAGRRNRGRGDLSADVGAEDVDEGGGIHCVHVLGEQGQAGRCKRPHEPPVHRPQARDGGEQSQGAAPRAATKSSRTAAATESVSLRPTSVTRKILVWAA